MTIGMCCSGPFSIAENYQITSDFAVIVADGKFDRPVKVVMQHCLLLSDRSEVVVLKANHLDVTEDNLYTFVPLSASPEVSSDSPELSFEIDEFCILTSATSSQDSSSSGGVTSSSAQVDALSTASGCDHEDVPQDQAPPLLREMSTSSESGFESLASPPPQKHVVESESSASEAFPTKRPRIQQPKKAMKRKYRKRRKLTKLECNAVLFQNKKEYIDLENYGLYRFLIFICRNCPGSIEVLIHNYSCLI